MVCDPNCHLAANSDRDDNGSNDIETQPGYRLTVNVPSHPFGISMVGIFITTENGYTGQASVPTAGDSSHTFDVPKNQWKLVRVCVNSENFSPDMKQTTVIHMKQLAAICQCHYLLYHHTLLNIT
jgi:hypothetical protein